MADIKKTAEDLGIRGRSSIYGRGAAEMKIEEAQGELDPGEAVIKQEMEVEADIQLQAVLEEKQKAEEKLQAALAEKQEVEAKLQAVLEEKMQAEAKLEMEIRQGSGSGQQPEPGDESDYEPETAVSSQDDMTEAAVSSRDDMTEAAVSSRDNVTEAAMSSRDNVTEAAFSSRDDVTEAVVSSRDDETEAEPDYNKDDNPSSEDATYHEERIGRGRSRARRSRRKGAGTHAQTPGGTTRFLENMAGSESAAANEGEDGSKMSGKGKKIAVIAACALAIAALGAGSVYAAMAQKYKRVFFPNTVINGVNASGLTVSEVKDLLTDGTKSYVLTIVERGGKQEQITGGEINLQTKFDGTLEQIVTKQNPYAWLSYQLNPAEYTIGTMIEYDDEALERVVEGLDCMDPALMAEPVNAAISDYVPGQGYRITPETKGTVIHPDILKSRLSESISAMQEQLSLEEAGAYKEPEIREDDASLRERLDAMNRFISTTVTYQFGDQTEVLNGDRTHDWLTTDEAGNLTVDAGKAAVYVEELAAAHNTSNKAKNFKTSYGQTIQVKGGTYGWKINQSGETEELIHILQSGQSQEREPVYSQKGASRGEKDYGDTYVEINLTAQHLFFYKNGSLLVESDFVSGNLSRGWGTPAGSFPLTYKQRNATLKGEGYRTPVDYWMPFNGGIGMHDAKWRGTFGGTIYKTGGSHGCINLPHAVAKIIYENITAGMPVICYNLAGTEKGTSAAAPPPAPAVPQPQPPVELPTEAPAEQPTEAPVPPPETTAPAGPGSDPGLTGGGAGPGGGPL